MGKWVHRLSDIDVESKTAVCANCGPVRIKTTIRPSGTPYHRCREAFNRLYKGWSAAPNKANRPKLYRKHLEDRCSRCGFEPEHIRQLDIHHIDGNDRNNDPANFQTLCANCHRLIRAPGFVGP